MRDEFKGHKNIYYWYQQKQQKVFFIRFNFIYFYFVFTKTKSPCLQGSHKTHSHVRPPQMNLFWKKPHTREKERARARVHFNNLHARVKIHIKTKKNNKFNLSSC